MAFLQKLLFVQKYLCQIWSIERFGLPLMAESFQACFWNVFQNLPCKFFILILIKFEDVFGFLSQEAPNSKYSSFTGCSLSDKHIFLTINEKYNVWFCQIYEDLHKLFWSSRQKFCKFLISENLCKS